MRSIAIPLRVGKGELARNEDLRQAIDSSLALLMATPRFSNLADPRYGFIFNNLRFEIINENEGVVYNSSKTPNIFDSKNSLYDKKVSGTSSNLNTFASELKKSIGEYERRLQDVTVSMTYIREERKIYVSVKGKLAESGDNYQYSSIINVWK